MLCRVVTYQCAASSSPSCWMLTALSRYVCDHCEKLITGVRILCLECGTSDTLDLCDRPACVNSSVAVKDSANSAMPQRHDPSHDIARLRAPVSGYDLGRILRRSKAALVRARKAIDEAERAVRAEWELNDAAAYFPVAKRDRYMLYRRLKEGYK